MHKGSDYTIAAQVKVSITSKIASITCNQDLVALRETAKYLLLKVLFCSADNGSKAMLNSALKCSVTSAKVHHGFRDDKKVEEHCFKMQILALISNLAKND